MGEKYYEKNEMGFRTKDKKDVGGDYCNVYACGIISDGIR